MDDRRQSGLWEQNAHGNYERKTPAGPYQYYQHPPSTDHRRSFSERAAEALPRGPLTDSAGVSALKAATQNGLERSTSTRKPNAALDQYGLINTSVGQQPNLKSPRTATARHAKDLPGRSPTFADHDDDEEEDDDIPENLRARAWSPAPLSPVSPTSQEASLPRRHASNASQQIRRGSVPDRSPLQNLEAKLDNISKEEKRARVEQAEHRAREEKTQSGIARSTTLRSGKGRVVEDGSRKANDSVKRDERRQVTAGAAPESPVSPREDDHGRFNSTNKTRGSAPGEYQDHDATMVSPIATATNDATTGLGRTQSQKYRHRARDAGFAGAAAAIAGASAATTDNAAARGKAAHERRKSQVASSQQGVQPTGKADATQDWGPAHAAALPSQQRRSESPERPRSKRLQKPPPSSQQWKALQESGQGDDSKRSIDSDPRLLQGNRIGAEGGRTKATVAPLEPDIISKADVKTGNETGVSYQIPPQTAAARQAKERVTFAPDVIDPDTDQHDHHFRNLFHHKDGRSYKSTLKPLDEWRTGEIAKLTATHLDLSDERSGSRSDAWWEKQGRDQHDSSLDDPYVEAATEFNPGLYLKCGPLLRFTGLRRSQKTGQGAHSWRGSVMIVTEDASSDLRKPPVLRLFAQPSELYRQKPHVPHEDDQQHGEKDDDPVTGQVKTSRTGRPIYVRSVHDIQHGADLSRQENNKGLYTASRPVVPAQQSHHVTSQNTSRISGRDGEKLRKYQDIRAHRLHVEHGCTFWRFNLEVELGAKAARIAYRINNGPATGFWVPARGETMNIMFHSCNGFSLSVDSTEFCGPDPLWRDVLNRHQSRPFNVMIGGGDQIYNDAAIRDTTHFKEWLQIKNPEHKHHADFTVEMQVELEKFYFNRYAMWFSQGFFGMANAQIPMVNIYDDHDIIDGFGSYPHHFMSSPVFTGLGAVAFKYYMLFQHQSLPTETTAHEPSWVLGASPGPYINELNRSIFVWLGEKVALLAVDCRTERMRDEILSQESYDIIFDRCRRELVAGDTKHLIVLLGVPIAYPRLNFLENILTSRLMDPIKALGRTGALGGFVNKFDGGVEILDDLDDHWTAKHHKEERNWFIQELQELAAEKSVRVTILGGDVHLGAVGQFYSNKKLGIPKDKDHRYMPNIISSAIVNTPPPTMMADVLNKRNKVHHLDKETDEDMIPMFSHDVDGSKRNNMRLLPRRNFAIIREYVPGSTPPPTPPRQPSLASLRDEKPAENEGDRRYPPGSIKRNMSLGRKPGSLIRRLSLRGKNPPVAFTPVESKPARPFSFHEDHASGEQDSLQRTNSLNAASAAQRPSLSFQRRPTNLSVKEARKAAAKGGPEGEDDNLPGHINLEHGLDISLCMEIDQHNPAGHTEPYRLLVPALWCHGTVDKNHLTLPTRGPSLFQRITGGRRSKQNELNQDTDGDKEEFYDDGDDSRAAKRTVNAATPAQSRNRELEELQATAAGAGSGAGQKHSQPRSPFHQNGYDLGAPPVGTGMASQQLNRPQQASQRASAAREDDYAEYDDSLAPSDIDSRDEDSIDVDQHRQSKAERFFGIGDGVGGQQQHHHHQQQGSDNVATENSGKKRSIWTPWKSGSTKV